MSVVREARLAVYRFLLRLHLDQIGSLEQAIQTVDRRWARRWLPFASEPPV